MDAGEGWEVFDSFHPQPDQDEDLPVGCVEPDSEGRPGWEGAPAAGAVPEEPCGLVLSTPSRVLRDRDTKEVRSCQATVMLV